MIGGYRTDNMLNKAYYYDIISQTWTTGPSLNDIGDMYVDSCATLKNNDTTLVVVTSRATSLPFEFHVQLLDLSNPERWFEGKSRILSF